MRRKIQKWVCRFYAEVMEDMEKSTGKKPDRRTFGSLVLIEMISFVLGLCCLIPCIKSGGISLSGVDYSGHGFWGWAALFLACVLSAGIIAMLVLWILGSAAKGKPSWGFLAVGMAFLILVGAARYTPSPIIGELGCISTAWFGFYLGLFAKPRDKEVEKNR